MKTSQPLNSLSVCQLPRLELPIWPLQLYDSKSIHTIMYAGITTCVGKKPLFRDDFLPLLSRSNKYAGQTSTTSQILSLRKCVGETRRVAKENSKAWENGTVQVSSSTVVGQQIKEKNYGMAD
jgi:hypothetical protein